MSTEKIAEIKLQLLGIAKEYSPSSFEEMMAVYEKLCTTLGV